MTQTEFDRLVAEAIAALPAPVRDRLEELVVEVRPFAADEQIREQGMDPATDDLLGLFEGVADVDRGPEVSGLLPSRIFLFQEAIEDEAEDIQAGQGGAFEDHVREEIRRTLWHEAAHQYGLDDEELHTIEEGRGWR